MTCDQRAHRCGISFVCAGHLSIHGATRLPLDVPAAKVTVDDVRAVASRLPRSYEALVGGRVKFRVGRIVYISFSRDGEVMGFAFPKEEREWLVGGSPDKFMLPSRSDMRYHWVLARLAALDGKEMRELVEDAWRMVVPKSVSAAYRGDPR